MASRWRTARRSLSLHRALILGVLNVTPDSFSDGGRFRDPDDAVAAGRELFARGADIVDVGGESTRPGADPVGEAEERRRVLPVIERLAALDLGPISVDTRRSRVAARAVAAGAEIVNDVSGLAHDPAMVEVVREAGAGLVIMHLRGDAQTMDALARYGDVAAEVAAELAIRRDAALRAGIAPEAIVLDPGLGFAKLPEHNYTLINRLETIVELGHPVLVGPSRKRFLGALTGRPPAERDLATAAACVAARLRGARLFRVHNVGLACEALAVADAVLAG